MEPEYEICECKYNPDEWRVEYDDDSNEIAIFVGTNARGRAEEYMLWKTTQKSTENALAAKPD